MPGSSAHSFLLPFQTCSPRVRLQTTHTAKFCCGAFVSNCTNPHSSLAFTNSCCIFDGFSQVTALLHCYCFGDFSVALSESVSVPMTGIVFYTCLWMLCLHNARQVIMRNEHSTARPHTLCIFQTLVLQVEVPGKRWVFFLIWWFINVTTNSLSPRLEPA